ncbi:hypothetical protein Hanom_Chr00s116126g01809621 [Helianthus anomalus]
MAETSRNEDRIKVQATFRLPLFTLQPTLPKRASRQARIVQCNQRITCKLHTTSRSSRA